jgi:acyl-CoA thioesterase-1
MRSVLLTVVVSALLGVAACSQGADVREGPPPGATSAEPASATSASTASTTTSEPPRIVFLGDSLTAGLGLDPDLSVPALVQRRLRSEGYDYEVVNAGVSGDTSAGGLRRLDWSLSGNVRVLVIELGANDGLRGLPVEELRKNLDEVIDSAQARGIDVLLTGMEAPPNYGDAYTSAFRSVYTELAETRRVAFMPFFLQDVAGVSGLNQRDGIHPNEEGARIVEANVWRFLEPMLDKRSTR